MYGIHAVTFHEKNAICVHQLLSAFSLKTFSSYPKTASIWRFFERDPVFFHVNMTIFSLSAAPNASDLLYKIKPRFFFQNTVETAAAKNIMKRKDFSQRK
jgi:hypothetical protein